MHLYTVVMYLYVDVSKVQGKAIWHISLTLYMYNVPRCWYMDKCSGNYCLDEPSGPLCALIRFISYNEVRSIESNRIWGFFFTFWGKALCLEVNSQILLMVLLSEWHVLTVFEDSTKQEDSVSSAHPKQAHVSDLHMHSTRELDLFLQSHDSKLNRHPGWPCPNCKVFSSQKGDVLF